MYTSGFTMRLSLLALSCCAATLANATEHQLPLKAATTSQASMSIEHLEVDSLPSGEYLFPSTSFNSAADHQFKGQLIKAKQQAELVVEQSSKSEMAHESDIIAPLASAITPLCPTLSTGFLYTLNGLVSGNSACYHFEITQRGKTTVAILNQGAQTNANLTLFRHEQDDSLTVVGNSANAGNGDEGILALTEPGHYYWFIDVVAGDGSAFNFAAVENTAADQYELNDIPALATVLPDKQNRVVANIDSATDVDYYSFTSVRGQAVMISLADSYDADEWQLELLNGSWQPLENDRLWTLDSLQVGQTVNVRVSPKVGVAIDPSHNYQLTLGSKATMASYSINGESNIVRIPFSQTNVSLPDQAYKKLYWSINVVDSKGTPLEGAQVTYKVDKNGDFEYTDYVKLTGSTGRASGVVDLGSCFGNFYREFYDWGSGLKTWWGTDFNIGFSKLEVQGGTGVADVALGHICRQKVIRTEF